LSDSVGVQRSGKRKKHGTVGSNIFTPMGMPRPDNSARPGIKAFNSRRGGKHFDLGLQRGRQQK